MNFDEWWKDNFMHNEVNQSRSLTQEEIVIKYNCLQAWNAAFRESKGCAFVEKDCILTGMWVVRDSRGKLQKDGFKSNKQATQWAESNNYWID